MIKRGWLILMITVAVILIFFNMKFSGWGVYNQTPSNVTVIPPNYFPVIGNVNDTLYSCEGDKLSYYFLASDDDGDPLESWIVLQNPFFVFWVSQTAIPPVPAVRHQFVIVSGTLDKGDIGGVNSGNKTYEETIYVDDSYNSTCCYDTEPVNITIIEINHAPQIENIGVQTIWTQGENSTFYEVVGANDFEYSLGYGDLTFNISIVNSTGSQVNLFNITQEGVINFTANTSTPIGVYNVTVCVRDAGLTNPHQNISDYCGQTGEAVLACDNFSITVTNENRAPNITDYYPKNLTFSAQGTQALYFNITTSDPDGTLPDAYWYVDGSLIEIDSGSSIDKFSYSFGCGVSGDYVIKVIITDGLLNSSLQWNVIVSAVSCYSPPISSGGGGAGGGVGGGVSLSNFEINPKFITTTIFRQEGKSFDISITNIGTEKLNISLDIENLTDVAILNEKHFILEPGKLRIVNLYLYALSEAKPGVYFGKIIVSDGFIEKYISVVLEIKDKKALFDFKVSIPQKYKSVYPGDNVNFLANILNVGLYGTAVDVDVYFYIMDLNKLTLYKSSKEVIAVEKNVSVERILNVPLTTVQGTYLVFGEMKYANITITTYDTFNVMERKYVKISYIFLILIVIVLILIILFLLYKRRKDRRERGYK